MSFTITYRTLFSVDIWHHFFLDDETGNFIGLVAERRNQIKSRYNLADFLNIQPSEATLDVLKGHQLIFKVTSSGFVIAAKADPADTSKIFNPLDDHQILRFTISSNDSSFQNYTNFQKSSKELLYFNNHDHNDADFPGLSQWPSIYDATLANDMENDGNPDTFAYPAGSMLVDDLPNPKLLKFANEGTNTNFSDDTKWSKDLPAEVYDAGATYQSGDRVLFSQAGIDSIYQAVESTSGNSPTDASKWIKITDLPLKYANNNDLFPKLDEIYSYIIANQGDTIRFDVQDALGQQVLSKTRSSDVDSELYQLDLSRLPSGKYTIKVIDHMTDSLLQESEGLILSSTDVNGQAIGLVEIMAIPASDNYKLTDGSDNFLAPKYEIRFKNRSTVWHFLDKEENLVASSAEPKPLIFRGYQKISHGGVDLPNPTAGMIRPTAQQTYSEIFI